MSERHPSFCQHDHADARTAGTIISNGCSQNIEAARPYRLGQPFVIENRPGAGTNLGTESYPRTRAAKGILRG
jgi:hypothetical protein